MLWLMFACGEAEKDGDSAEALTFESEEVLTLGGEESTGFFQFGSQLVEGFILPFEAPASTYEVVNVAIDVAAGLDDCSSSINVFAVATEDPMAISELTEYFTYSGLAPYTFPDLVDSRSGVLELTSESNPAPSQLGDTDRYEFTLTFDSPLLIEDSGSFWIGVGLHEGERTCLSSVENRPPVGYAFSAGEAMSLSDSIFNGDVIKMRTKVRY